MPQTHSSDDSKIRESTDEDVTPVAELGTQHTQCTVYRDKEGKCSVSFSQDWTDGECDESAEDKALYEAKVGGVVSAVMAAMALSPALWCPVTYNEFIATIEDALMNDD